MANTIKQMNVRVLSTDCLLTTYQELDGFLQYGELEPDDYADYINCSKELKRRGISI